MKGRATAGGKVGKARRRSVKRRHKDRRISTLTDSEKQLREERREHAETRRQLAVSNGDCVAHVGDGAIVLPPLALNATCIGA